MHIEEIINERTINLNLEAKTKIEAIKKLIKMLYADRRIAEKDMFLQEVLEREKTESTDMGIGVAIPHGRSPSVKRASVAIGKLTAPIRWDGLKESEGKPVYAIFLLASSPDDNGKSHIEIISKIASLLIDDDFIAFLKRTNSKLKLLDSIKTHIGGK
ncbi:MAG: PTS sugar transporter subunit IIA [Anaerolineaceae bacterium]|nr:PTS sugar transporter subunit IIA [Anaerolineaceae bacterium]